MTRQGYSAYQLVFGRDPEFPGDDLFSQKPNVIANSAILEDAIAEFSFRARKAVLQSLDHRAARIALNSRLGSSVRGMKWQYGEEVEASRKVQPEMPWHSGRQCWWQSVGVHA